MSQGGGGGGGGSSGANDQAPVAPDITCRQQQQQQVCKSNCIFIWASYSLILPEGPVLTLLLRVGNRAETTGKVGT